MGPTHRRRSDRSLRQLQRELVGQARLFDDPGAYIAGVRDAFDAFLAGRAPDRPHVRDPRPRAARRQPPRRSRA